MARPGQVTGCFPPSGVFIFFTCSRSCIHNFIVVVKKKKSIWRWHLRCCSDLFLSYPSSPPVCCFVAEFCSLVLDLPGCSILCFQSSYTFSLLAVFKSYIRVLLHYPRIMADVPRNEKTQDTGVNDPIHMQDEEEHMNVREYLITRLTTLVPPMNPAPNPFKTLTLLNAQQWAFFAVCFVLQL